MLFHLVERVHLLHQERFSRDTISMIDRENTCNFTRDACRLDKPL